MFGIISGSSSKITEQNLKGTDIDSDSLKLRYVLTKDPPAGKLQLSKSGGAEKISVKGPVQSFTQDDVNKGAACLFFCCPLSMLLDFCPAFLQAYFTIFSVFTDSWLRNICPSTCSSILSY